LYLHQILCLHTKNEVSRSSFSKVAPRTGQTDRDAQTDVTERITGRIKRFAKLETAQLGVTSTYRVDRTLVASVVNEGTMALNVAIT